MTKIEIIKAMREGATMHCTEGVSYRVWIMIEGVKTFIRKATAEQVCREMEDKLIFEGFNSKGIRLNE